VGVLRYKTDLFQATTIRQVLANFQTVLATLVVNPDLRLAELPRFATANAAQPAPVEPYVAPATELEQTVATLWQEILHLAPIGVQANYFALGGRSLGMVQIGAEVQKRFNCSLSVAELFQIPTIRGMAQAVNQASERAKLDVRSIQSRIQRQKEAIKNRQMAMQRRGYSHE
jgi:acyl carrier protein